MGDLTACSEFVLRLWLGNARCALGIQKWKRGFRLPWEYHEATRQIYACIQTMRALKAELKRRGLEA